MVVALSEHSSAGPLSRAAPRRNVVAVASGKGGVGKTWFAVTLAHALAKAGKRILLVDADLGLANVDVQLGLMPQATVNKVVAGQMTLKQAAIPYAEGGFHIVAGLSGSAGLAALPPERLERFASDLAHLAADYDLVILDLGAGVDRTVQTLSGSAGTCIVLTTDEPTSLTDAYAFIKLMAASRKSFDVRLVVNMANSSTEGQHTYTTIRRACEGFLKISPPLLGIVRRDSHVRDSIKAQAPLLLRFPNCFASQDVTAIARRLLDGS